jgi:GT2 family glycosyltransferase
LKFSIIISYKESGEDRRNNLKRLLNYLSWLLNPDTEIVIVEQDTESRIDWLDKIKKHEQIKHVFVKNEGIFNKGWGYNIGVKESEGNYLVFNDSDMFVKLETYRFALGLLSQFDVVNPYKNIYYLDEENTEKYVSNNYNVGIVTINKPTPVYVISGGIFMMRKDKYLQIKGFDEDCYGYGHEDDILDVKIKKMGLSVQTLNDFAIHIHHQGITKNDDYYSFQNVNKILYNEYVEMNEIELRKKIDSVESFGDKTSDTSFSIKKVKSELYRQATETIVDSILSNIDTEFVDGLITESAQKGAEYAYELFLNSFTDKLHEEFDKIKFTDKDKKTLVEKIMGRMKL